MTATERAKRSDALYYETVSVTRRVLCDMIANREADLEDARESVRRLMTQRDERLARAEADNAKLRELVRDMQHAIACLVVLGDDYAGEHEDELCALDDRMRELGVEVTS